MASLNGLFGSIFGPPANGVGFEAKSGWKLYILERGAHVASASTGNILTCDSADAAGRFAINDYVQVGEDVTKIRQVTLVSGTQITLSATVIAAKGARIYNLGTTNPDVVASVATYHPSTTIYERDDDSSDVVTDSQIETGADGKYIFYAADALYDALVQDDSGILQGGMQNIALGNSRVYGDLLPDSAGARDIGSAVLYWRSIYSEGSFTSYKANSGTNAAYELNTSVPFTGNTVLFRLKNGGVTKLEIGITGDLVGCSNVPNVINVKGRQYGAQGDDTTDDSTAFANAISDAELVASTASGAVVHVPKGAYRIAATLALASNVSLLLDSGAIIRASVSPAFPGTTPMIRIGKGSGAVTNVHVQGGTIDCGSASASRGIYSTEASGDCSVRGVKILNAGQYGIFFDTATCHSWLIEGCDVQVNDGAANRPILIDGGSGVNANGVIRSCRVRGTSLLTTFYGIELDARNVHCEGIRGKQLSATIGFGEDFCSATNVYGETTGGSGSSNVISVSSGVGNVTLRNIAGGITQTLIDNDKTFPVAGGSVIVLTGQGPIQYYRSGPTGGNEVECRLATAGVIINRDESDHELAGDLYIDNAAGLATLWSRQHQTVSIAAAGAQIITPPAKGIFFHVNVTAAGAGTADSISVAGNTGRIIVIMPPTDGSNVTIRDRRASVTGNILMSHDTNTQVTLRSQTFHTVAGQASIGMVFYCDGSYWYALTPRFS